MGNNMTPCVYAIYRIEIKTFYELIKLRNQPLKNNDLTRIWCKKTLMHFLKKSAVICTCQKIDTNIKASTS